MTINIENHKKCEIFGCGNHAKPNKICSYHLEIWTRSYEYLSIEHFIENENNRAFESMAYIDAGSVLIETDSVMVSHIAYVTANVNTYDIYFKPTDYHQPFTGSMLEVFNFLIVNLPSHSLV